MIKVSVIIPCYNVAEYLPRCIESVITQTLKDIEIICIDDKSTDNTLGILKKYAKKDNRIHIINHKENLGVAVARNDSMDAARGEYIGFVDPDDYIDTDFYEKLYDKAQKTNADIVKAGVISVNMNNNRIFKDTRTFKHIYKFSCSFWAAIYKHDFLKKYNIQFPAHIRTSQDSVFLTQSCINTNDIEFVNDTFYRYFYQRPGSLDSQFLSHDKAESKYNAFKINLDLIERGLLNKKMRHLFIDEHVLRYIHYEISKDFEFDSDREKLFRFAVDVYKKYGMNKYFRKRFHKYHFLCIKENSYEDYINSKRCRVYLFWMIPFILMYSLGNDLYIKLFEFIPILKIKR